MKQNTFYEELGKLITPEVKKELAGAIVERAKQGDIKAFELIRDILGENPKWGVNRHGMPQGVKDLFW